jgi:hypothetical protein
MSQKQYEGLLARFMNRLNPNGTGNGDKYLDQEGNPVPKGSRPSHLSPSETA